MSDQNNLVQPPAESPSVPSSADPSTAGQVVSTHSKQQYTAATKINSIEDLKTKAPKLYNAMLQGIAMTICRDMQDHIERFRKLMREGRQQ